MEEWTFLLCYTDLNQFFFLAQCASLHLVDRAAGEIIINRDSWMIPACGVEWHKTIGIPIVMK